MSAGQLRRHRSTSRSSSRRDEQSSFAPPAPSITPKAQEFEPCAATAAFFLYAQRNVILCLHHDTLAIERRLTLHREDVSWITVDNVSERGAGRLVVSYDVGNTAIVWDLLTGEEVARFAAYEQINAATFMRNGNVAFGEHPMTRSGLLCAPGLTRSRQLTRKRDPLRARDLGAHLGAHNLRPYHRVGARG